MADETDSVHENLSLQSSLDEKSYYTRDFVIEVILGPLLGRWDGDGIYVAVSNRK